MSCLTSFGGTRRQGVGDENFSIYIRACVCVYGERVKGHKFQKLVSFIVINITLYMLKKKMYNDKEKPDFSLT